MAAEQGTTAIFDQAAHIAARRAAYKAVSARLAAVDDQELEALLQQATPMGPHIGGTSARLDIDGVCVFVKRVPLTDIERAPQNAGSTANHFELPLYYQYGVGSTGFGAWRELAANRMATDWALAGDCVNFPLLHHWRVLPRQPQPPLTQEQELKLDSVVDYWNGSSAIRARRLAIRNASASIVLLLEHLPQTLEDWLTDRLAEGGEATEAALRMVDAQLTSTAAFINARGMLHFDLHCRNVLTDGRQLYVGDFGLATCAAFDLSPAEKAFFEQHRSYDRCYVRSHLVHWFDAARQPHTVTPGAAALLERYRPVAAVMGQFFNGLRNDSKLTPYPAGALEQALPRADT